MKGTFITNPAHRLLLGERPLKASLTVTNIPKSDSGGLGYEAGNFQELSHGCSAGNCGHVRFV